jgi:predicted DNA-binding protein with PD1-like motif
MKSKSVASGEERTFVLILDQGEEAFQAITEFANKQNISGASVSAVGAFAEAKVGWFDLAAKTYKPIGVGEQCEVLSLLGDVAEGDDGKASLHLHAVLGLQDGSVRGGHFSVGLGASDPRGDDPGNRGASASEKTPRPGHRLDQHLALP